MPLVELLEGCHIALSGFLRQRVIRFRLRLGFGCGHVFLLGKPRKIRHDLTSPRISKERQPFPQHFPSRLLRGV
jgi:hypothetical protein